MPESQRQGERICGDGDRAAHVPGLGVVLEGAAQAGDRRLQLVWRERRQLGAAEAEEQLGGLVVHRLVPLRGERALEVGERLLGGMRRERGLTGERGVVDELVGTEDGLCLGEVMGQLGRVASRPRAPYSSSSASAMRAWSRARRVSESSSASVPWISACVN